MPSSLAVDTHILSLKAHGEDLETYVKRYRLPANPNAGGRKALSRNDSVTILLLHGLGCEQWEPTIERLFELEKAGPGLRQRPTICEVWSIECPDHGQSALLNETVLRGRVEPVMCRTYALTVLALFRSGLLAQSLKPRFVLVGQCGGAVTAVLSTMMFREPSGVPFTSIILINPWFYSAQLIKVNADARREASQYAEYSKTIPDIWRSREEALRYLKAEKYHRSWHPQVLEQFVKSGVTSLPSRAYPLETEGVTLVYPRTIERRAMQLLYEVQPMLQHLRHLGHRVPVHVAFGEIQSTA
ncbi:hypothetical protein BD309DRAFT_1060246 [Dichomitus squalens]|nr:hypothetical protein BD309DRAFT_1060246 [Dichomitus squalens]